MPRGIVWSNQKRQIDEEIVKMPRNQEFDTDQVLKAAIELFWRDGYKTTTIRDLVRATGVAESSLYHAFGGKRRLFEATLDRYRAIMRQRIRRLEDVESPGEGLRWYLMRTVNALSGQEDCRGCLVTNTTIELAPHDVEMQREIRAIYPEVEDAFCRVIARAQETREITVEAPPRMLARFYLQNLEGLRVLAKSGNI